MTEQEILGRKRSEALQKFLDEHNDLFTVQACEDIELSGPEMITGAMLILRSRDTGADGELFMSCVAPYALGWSEKIGMVERQRMSYRTTDDD